MHIKFPNKVETIRRTGEYPCLLTEAAWIRKYPERGDKSLLHLA